MFKQAMGYFKGLFKTKNESRDFRQKQEKRKRAHGTINQTCHRARTRYAKLMRNHRVTPL